jgi:predicted RNA methylase
MRIAPLDPHQVRTHPKQGPLFGFLSSLADLAQPKTAMRTLEDSMRLAGYRQALQACLNDHPNAHVLALSSGGGALPILAAQAGAGRVSAIERGRMLYRMAKQVLSANADNLPKDCIVDLLPRGLHNCTTNTANGESGNVALASASPSASASAIISGDLDPGKQREVREDQKDDQLATKERLHSRANVLVTDLFDHAVLKMGILPAIDYAAEHLLVEGAIVLPSKVVIRAVLLELKLPEQICGFDLSTLDRLYRWWPGDEKVDLQKLPHRALSEPFVACEIDLQERLEKVQLQRKRGLQGAVETEICSNGGGAETLQREKTGENAAGSRGTGAGDFEDNASNEWEYDDEIHVKVTENGVWNAVGFWFELRMLPDQREMRDGVVNASVVMPAQDSEEMMAAPLLASYLWPHHNAGDKAVGSDDNRSIVPKNLVSYCKSWGQAVQYLDGSQVSAESSVLVRVRRDAGQILFEPRPVPCRLRTALAPRWHFDMVQDTLRNDAYDAAIRRAIARKRDAGYRRVTALDIGAGSGLLSMMAARAGADQVFAAEISSHMADVAEETAIMNGYFGKIMVLDRDVRRMDAQPKSDGTPQELPHPADVAVFEVFDSGLIGEGALHLLTAARARLLFPDAALVPAAATVYAQPIQLRLDTVQSIDVQQVNRWRWRPEYEGLELGRCRETWIPLAPPQEVFKFDFYSVERSMQPEESVLPFAVDTDGVFNAMAMWFELHLDEATMLSTSPYEEKGPTWQQAVQWMPEARVTTGNEITVTARHDTYSISYAVEAERNGGAEALTKRSTGVPLVDPVWKSAHDALQGVNSQLVKACVQNPLEFRAAAQAAVAFAARPHDLGLDGGQAAEFCMKMMG